jgi:hypothetical protein
MEDSDKYFMVFSLIFLLILKYYIDRGVRRLAIWSAEFAIWSVEWVLRKLVDELDDESPQTPTHLSGT